MYRYIVLYIETDTQKIEIGCVCVGEIMVSLYGENMRVI